MTEQEKYLEENLAKVRARMEDAARRAGRSPQEILLCAASKTQSVETVRLASRLNIDLFGENHVQELVEKYDAGAYNGKPAHMIGHLQTNKVKQVVGRAALVHSVDSPRLMAALEKEAAKKGLCQDILIEVNIGEEASKSGVAEEELWALAEDTQQTPHLRLRGLMAIPPVNQDDAENRRQLQRMYRLFCSLAEKHYPGSQVDILSMGMSGDYENAILEGATIVRVGTAIFGARAYPAGV
ncbi:MAG: YggS family pyridoxal phosphate-dependent enzyme [Bacteroidales bacterium]|nr:YggS family pyridoxal phosphate-dependent enzyme [Fournierella massiliensis]MCF2556723.1 YggS family pyridoxal phosphate-dependent enzyme [Fournierella massiliensis]MCI6739928.1 YggS family pyridoxal phosphate-dependent enzyme [Bacteroidales bacterium]